MFTAIISFIQKIFQKDRINEKGSITHSSLGISSVNYREKDVSSSSKIGNDFSDSTQNSHMQDSFEISQQTSHKYHDYLIEKCAKILLKKDFATNDYYREIDYTEVNVQDIDKLFKDSARLVVETRSGSVSNLQRRLNLGYTRAGKIIDQLEAFGVIGPLNGSMPREVLVRNEDELKIILDRIGYESISIPDSFFDKNKDEIEKRSAIILTNLENQRTEQENLRRKEQEEKIRRALLEREEKKKLHKSVYDQLKKEGKISNLGTDRRELIPQEIMDAVWNRDSGKCVQCGNNQNLEFDHVIPFSKGGANTYRNLQLLCRACNATKSNNIG